MLQKNPTFFPQLNKNSKTKIKQQAIQWAIQWAITKRYGWCQVFSESLTDPTPVLCAIISPSKANCFHGPSPKDAFKHSHETCLSPFDASTFSCCLTVFQNSNTET